LTLRGFIPVERCDLDGPIEISRIISPSHHSAFPNHIASPIHLRNYSSIAETDHGVSIGQALNGAGVRHIERWGMAVLPHQISGHCFGVEPIFDRACLRRRVSGTIVVDQKVAVCEYPHRVLRTETTERVVPNLELIVAPTKAPDDGPTQSVDLRDLTLFRYDTM